MLGLCVFNFTGGNRFLFLCSTYLSCLYAVVHGINLLFMLVDFVVSEMRLARGHFVWFLGVPLVYVYVQWVGLPLESSCMYKPVLAGGWRQSLHIFFVCHEYIGDFSFISHFSLRTTKILKAGVPDYVYPYPFLDTRYCKSWHF